VPGAVEPVPRVVLSVVLVCREVVDGASPVRDLKYKQSSVNYLQFTLPKHLCLRVIYLFSVNKYWV
jgi:hypothetical protein